MKDNFDDYDPFYPFFKAVKKVIQNWGVIELLLFIFFCPLSLIYLALRICQEWE